MTSTNSNEGKGINSQESSGEKIQSQDEVNKKLDLIGVLKVLQEGGVLKEIPDMLKNWLKSSNRRVTFEWITILVIVVSASGLCYIGKISGEITAVLFSAIIGYILGKNV
jgi:hypothetical protein